MIAALFLILAVIVFGDAAMLFLDLPIPGAIIGLLCATAFFVIRGAPHPSTEKMFGAIIPHAPVLFVPAGVGVMAHVNVIAAKALIFAAAITIGTLVTMVVTGLVMTAFLHTRRVKEFN